MKKKFTSVIIFLIFTIISSTIFKIPNHQSVESSFNEEREEQSGAMKSLNFWTDQRAYPYNDIPDNAYLKAYEKMQKDFLQRKIYCTDSWITAGPLNVGGRTKSIALNPQNPYTLFAGSASGGLWRSYTDGIGSTAWTHINTGFPVLGVNAIAIHPADSNIIYIGTGEVYAYQNSIGGLNIRTTRGSYGIGILKTTNYGVTWTKSLDWSYNQRRGVQVIKFNPANPNVIYAGTSEGLYKSTDAGSSWNQIHNVIMTYDIAINQTNPDLIVISCGNLGSTGYGIYRSSDGGVNWTKITNGLPSSWEGKVHLSPFAANPNILYASIGKGTATGAGTVLCKSYNFGLSWTTVNSSSDYATYQGWYSHFVVPHPTDSTKILCGGIDIWKSTNGGNTLTTKSSWSAWYLNTTPPIGGPEGPPNYSHADHHCYVIDPTNSNIVYFGNDGGIFRTSDFGETFAGCNGGYQTTQFYKRIGVGQKDSLIAVGGLQDNASVVYSGSTAWRRVGGGDGCCSGISWTNNDTMYSSSQYLAVMRSTNRGINWSYSYPPSNNEAFNGPFIVCPSNSKIMYAGGDKLYKSTNSGTNWFVVNNDQTFTGDPVLVIESSYSNTDTVFLATAPNLQRARVYRSTNGGTSFTEITGILPDRYIVDIAVNPLDARTVYCAVSGFGSAHLFKSTDAGTTWTAVGNDLPDVPTSAVIVNPFNTNNIYVGNDLGVFVSTDGGISFTDFNSGFLGTATLVMDLRISPKDKMLYAATHGNGVFKRKLIDNTTKIDDNSKIATGYSLLQNYPNPFNPVTTIQYSLINDQHIVLKIFDYSGKEIATLVDEYKKAGNYSVQFDASKLQRGGGCPSGVYFYRIKTTNYTCTKKMLLLK